MSGDVTQLLNALQRGESRAEELVPLVYDELRVLARQKLAHETPGQTLSATALVHEAYLRLVGSDTPQQFTGRGHFFAAAAEAMRRILIENARRKSRIKHGGEYERVELDRVELAAAVPDEELLALDEALRKLESEAPEKAKLVKLRYFAGMTIAQAADVMGISHATAERYWTFARVWLYSALHDQPT